MSEKHDEQDRIEASEREDLDEHEGRATILPEMPTWMAQGEQPPVSAVVRRRRPDRCVVFEFESLASRVPSREVA